MKEKTKITLNFLGMTLLILALGMPSFAEAGRNHHRHHHHHHDSYGVIISQPPVYINQPYYQPYAQPIYGYEYHPVPAPVIAPGYGYAPNVMLDIHTGNGHFMLHY